MMKLFVAMFIIGVAVIAWRCVLFVEETQYVIVTQFGRPVETLSKAGPYFKLPYQSSLAIDRRMQIYNPRPSEFLTSEKKNVDLDVYVLWSVDDPQRFIETVNDVAGAESRIHDVVWSKLAAAVSRNPLEHLVTIDAKTHGLEQLVSEVEADCAADVQSKYGIKIVDVRIKRIGLPDQIRESVFERMRKERARIAQRYRSEGNEEAMKIRAAADKEKAVILASANAEAEIIRGKAEAQATRTYSEAHRKDPQFFELTRTLEAYKKILDEKTTILLSGDSELLKYLSRSPGASKKD
jgi:membrane protease subunit HflC